MNDLGKKRPQKKVIWLLIGLSVVLAAAATAILIYRGGEVKAPQAALKIVPNNVDLQIKNFHYTEVGDENWKWEINAETAKYLKKENLAHFDMVTIRIIRRDGRQLVITGRKGLLHTDTKDATVRGDVQAKIDEDAVIKTDYLDYVDSKKMVRTDDSVVLTSPNLQVKGDGMDFLLNERKVLLRKHVKAVYTKQVGQ